MKRSIFAFLLVGAASLSLAGSIPPAIRARYGEIESALQALDTKKFESFFAPQFISIDHNGVKTKREAFLSSVRELFKDATSAKAAETLKSAKTSKGVVMVSFDFTLKISNAEGWTQIHEVGTDYWKKQNGKWLMIKTIDKEFNVTAVK